MKYFSAFSGIGGFELGIKQVLNDAECVGYSEVDKYAIQIYENHFNHKNYGNIKEINTKDLSDFELFVGGFPCQSFSIAGKRGGFNDTRGTLFFEIARIAREKQPRLLLLENVKGLLSHDKGKTFRTIITTLDELGYDLQWQVLNSKNHGVPQNRERVFIIGHLRGTTRPEVFPLGRGDQKNNGQVHPTIDANYCRGYSNQRKMIQQINKPKHSNDRIYRKEDTKIRRLTPIECEKLQGFPENWTEGVSDTQRYKTLGNAVTVNVIRDIMLEINRL